MLRNLLNCCERTGAVARAMQLQALAPRDGPPPPPRYTPGPAAFTVAGDGNPAGSAWQQMLGALLQTQGPGHGFAGPIA
jgi:hypothetical protein